MKDAAAALPARDRRKITCSGARRATQWLKRLASKKARRAARLDPEGAPRRRRYSGWWA